MCGRLYSERETEFLRRMTRSHSVCRTTTRDSERVEYMEAFWMCMHWPLVDLWDKPEIPLNNTDLCNKHLCVRHPQFPSSWSRSTTYILSIRVRVLTRHSHYLVKVANNMGFWFNTEKQSSDIKQFNVLMHSSVHIDSEYNPVNYVFYKAYFLFQETGLYLKVSEVAAWAGHFTSSMAEWRSIDGSLQLYWVVHSV